MQDFDNFKESIIKDYSAIRNKVSLKADTFIEKHSETSLRRNEVYAELFAMELLEKYHEWRSN